MRLFKVVTFLVLTLITASCIGVGLDAGYYSPAYVEPSYSTPTYVETLPGGSYLDTCRECRISAGSLSCACKNVQGGWMRSSLYVGNCRQSIHNDDGRLKCGQPIVVRPIEVRPIVVPRPIELPRGSYKATCQGCTMMGSTLSCQCEMASSGYRRTSLETRGCYNEINNDDGYLVCRPVAEKLPAGSYLQSCNGCKVQNGSLSCSCANERGYNVSTSLYVRNCNQGVSNQDGRLTCGTPRPAPMPAPTPLPAGSYKQSCSGCTNSGGILACMCQDENGSNVRTSTSAYCSQDISNQNGRLTCGTPAKPRAAGLPRGSYQQSCQSCEVSNDSLSCRCADESGSYRSTSLSLGGCFSSIENCNGRLSCGNC